MKNKILVILTILFLCIYQVYSDPKFEDAALLEKVHKILDVTTLQNPNPKTRAEELDGWEVPEDLLKNYPHHLSGFDLKGRPIWIAKWGNFNLKKIIQDGGKSQELFTKYVEKTARIFHKSAQILSSPQRPVNEAVFIVDFAGLKLEQVADVQTLSYALTLAGIYAHDILGGTNKVILVNVNYIAQVAIRHAKTLVGGVFHKIDVFGPNKAQWLSYFRRLFPPESLPEEYGGQKGHTPLFIYG